VVPGFQVSLSGTWARTHRPGAGCRASATMAKASESRIGGAEVGEAHALGGQTVEVRSADLRPVDSQIAEAEVVAEDEDDVGSAGRRRH